MQTILATTFCEAAAHVHLHVEHKQDSFRRIAIN